MWSEEENQEAFWIRQENRLLKLEKEKLEKETEIENLKIEMAEAMIEEAMTNFNTISEGEEEWIEPTQEEEQEPPEWNMNWGHPFEWGFKDETGIGSKKCENNEEKCETSRKRKREMLQ